MYFSRNFIMLWTQYSFQPLGDKIFQQASSKYNAHIKKSINSKDPILMLAIKKHDTTTII